jgi:hypothetical protein
MPAIAERRERLLRVMGVTPWRLRVGDVAPGDSVESANEANLGDTVGCVVILPAGSSARELDLLGKALRAFGPITGRAARLEVGERGLGQVPVASAYIVFGDAQAHALGRDLPTAVLSAAQIVLVDPPSTILVDAAAKRRLWNGLRALGRAFVTG